MNKLKSWREEVEKKIERSYIEVKSRKVLHIHIGLVSELATIKKATQMFEEMIDESFNDWFEDTTDSPFKIKEDLKQKLKEVRK